jgi:hypothetical protein
LAAVNSLLTLDGDATPIEHLRFAPNATSVDASLRRQLTNVTFLYTHKPFATNTKYHVKVSGMFASGVLAKEWTFTTGAARRF